MSVMLSERTPTSTTSWNKSGHVAQDTNTIQPFTSSWRISSRVYGNHYMLIFLPFSPKQDLILLPYIMLPRICFSFMNAAHCILR
ncbi:unnamed protein product [Acanthoscelides obtectus]|uniref:Uncharacterized protein n=1 Tax=Acanthoscelides obtectus TaxID=200917 RepID=A0A9P0LFL0_ACAOB|nr:unnamed protein product [Acanthoscelides obtectus]CAK1637922.1 hypothetical protein AOBTE_LOCUS10294 [Acanthoscelides obtectus]